MTASRSAGLPTIFSIFLGLMLTAFVGVGVYTFHPSPQPELRRQLQELDRRQEAVRDARPPEALDEADRQALEEIREERNRLQDQMREVWAEWGRSTSIILIAFATLAMAVSLVRGEQLPVISNGLLIGGVFSMLYGVGWIVATDTSVSRFVVITVALVITLALGYLRFVRGQAVTASPAGVAFEDAGSLVELERRVRRLEGRLDEAASALGRGDDS